jgi:predicted ribosome quality control (RQC) complex YloA/Tae2 family protein
MSFSSFDVHVMVEELQDIAGMRVNTVYQIDGDFRIKLFGKGRKDLFITSEAFYLTRYPKKAPMVPKGFAMQLRKHLKGSFLYAINQINFDRIVEFHFGYDQEVQHILVAELFAKGNVILKNPEGEIIGILRKEKWKDRILYPHQTYAYPPSRLSIDISREKFHELNIQTEKDLAVTFNFGKLYAKEIFLRAKSADPDSLYDAMHSFEKSPAIIVGKDVVPYDLLVYRDLEKIYFDTFTEAADEFYKPEIQELEVEEDRILESQKEAIQRFMQQKETSSRHADLIYQNFTLINDILKTLTDAHQHHEWDEIVDIIKGSTHETARKILNIDYHKGKVTVDLGEPVIIDLQKNINENAALYYEHAKKMDHKIRGAQKAMEKVKNKKESQKPKKEEIRVLRKREWYEKFHWCFSSDRVLILGGRDKKSNEMLVKRYMEATDLYVHADIQGAPSVIIKNGEKAPEKTIEEAAMVAAAYSRAWNHFGSLDCYWVLPDQVTKSPPSGEYLTTGAFFITGSKHFVKVPLEISIGLYEDKIMAGPQSAVSTHASRYVGIGFGDEKKERLAKQISHLLDYSDIDEIIRVLPGQGRILKQ